MLLGVSGSSIQACLAKEKFPAGLLETDFPSPYEPVLCVKYLIR